MLTRNAPQLRPERSHATIATVDRGTSSRAASHAARITEPDPAATAIERASATATVQPATAATTPTAARSRCHRPDTGLLVEWMQAADPIRSCGTVPPAGVLARRLAAVPVTAGRIRGDGETARHGTRVVNGTGAVRVLVLVKGLGRGGAERLVVDQVNRRDPSPPTERPIEYEVGFIRPDKDQLVAEVAAGVTVHRLGGGGPMWVARLVLLLRRRRPDVVHSHSPVIGAIAAPLVRAGLAGRRAVHVYTEHNRWPAYRRVTRLADQLTMALNAAVWTVSEDVRNGIRPARLRRRTSPLVHGVDVGAIAARGRRRRPREDASGARHRR